MAVKMWRLPPLWVRRLVLAPLIVLIAFVWLPVAVWQHVDVYSRRE